MILLCVLLTAAPIAISLPGSSGRVGFDDLTYSSALGKVLVPAGSTGRLDLIDPVTRAVTSVSGFSTEAAKGGHGDGTTSADSGAGWIFASDRGRREVAIVDPKTLKIVATAKLAAGPDYVRWVESLKEVWVTEPSDKAIEFFALEPGPKLTLKGKISVPGGPEALVIDATRGRAYTHTWKDASVALDLKSHREVARWKNGCGGSRGISLDGSLGLLFIGCDEGKAVVLDVAHEGKKVGEASAPRGVDLIAFNPKLRHLYVPGGDDAQLAVLAVSDQGKLSPVRVVKTAADATCVTADERGGVWLCDPKAGQILLYLDVPAD